MTRNEKKAEALKRMRMLHLHDNVVREFEQEDKLNLSEHGGFLYWLNEDQKEVVAQFEEKYNAVVYHVVHDYTEFGELLSLLYVSDESEEWEYDLEDVKDGYPYAYVKNLTDDWCSEFGRIGIKSQIGGLMRIA